jgi:hypothetical protein
VRQVGQRSVFSFFAIVPYQKYEIASTNTQQLTTSNFYSPYTSIAVPPKMAARSGSLKLAK